MIFLPKFLAIDTFYTTSAETCTDSEVEGILLFWSKMFRRTKSRGITIGIPFKNSSGEQVQAHLSRFTEPSTLLRDSKLLVLEMWKILNTTIVFNWFEWIALGNSCFDVCGDSVERPHLGGGQIQPHYSPNMAKPITICTWKRWKASGILNPPLTDLSQYLPSYELLSKKRQFLDIFYLKTVASAAFYLQSLFARLNAESTSISRRRKKLGRIPSPETIFPFSFRSQHPSIPSHSCPDFHLELMGVAIENWMGKWSPGSESFQVFFSGEI